MFADRRVREALTRMFDFEWLNKQLFRGLYARTGSFFERSTRAFAAGLDLALHCNGDLTEAAAVALAAPLLAGPALARVERARARVAEEFRRAAPFDPVDARKELASALATLA